MSFMTKSIYLLMCLMVKKRTTNTSYSPYWFMMVRVVILVITMPLFTRNWNNGISSMTMLLKEQDQVTFFKKISVVNIKTERLRRTLILRNTKLKTVALLICLSILKRTKQRKFSKKLQRKTFQISFRHMPWKSKASGSERNCRKRTSPST